MIHLLGLQHRKILNSNKRTLYIKGAAKQIYIDYFNDNQQRMYNVDDYTRAILAKLEIIVERIAACIHLINGDSSDVISEETMQYAVSLMPYYESCALKVYDTLCNGKLYTLSSKDLVKQIFARFNVKSQNSLAQCLGVAQPYISKCLCD